MTQLAERSLSLYEIETELMEAFDRVQEIEQLGTGDETEEINVEAAKAILQTYVQASVEKRDRLGKFIGHLKSNEDAIQSEIERLKGRLEQFQKTRDRIESYIMMVMDRIGVTKLEGQLHSFSKRKNPPSVVVEDELVIPTKYLVQPPPPAPRPDKKAIKDAIQAGQEVSGARLDDSKVRLVVK